MGSRSFSVKVQAAGFTTHPMVFSVGKIRFSHRHKVNIDVQSEDGDTIENISVGLNSSVMMREALGLDIDKDHLNISWYVPFH